MHRKQENDDLEILRDLMMNNGIKLHDYVQGQQGGGAHKKKREMIVSECLRAYLCFLMMLTCVQ